MPLRQSRSNVEKKRKKNHQPRLNQGEEKEREREEKTIKDFQEYNLSYFGALISAFLFSINRENRIKVPKINASHGKGCVYKCVFAH